MIIFKPIVRCDGCGASFDLLPATPLMRAERNVIVERRAARDVGWKNDSNRDLDLCPVCNGTEKGPL